MNQLTLLSCAFSIQVSRHKAGPVTLRRYICFKVLHMTRVSLINQLKTPLGSLSINFFCLLSIVMWFCLFCCSFEVWVFENCFAILSKVFAKTFEKLSNVCKSRLLVFSHFTWAYAFLVVFICCFGVRSMVCRYFFFWNFGKFSKSLLKVFYVNGLSKNYRKFPKVSNLSRLENNRMFPKILLTLVTDQREIRIGRKIV